MATSLNWKKFNGKKFHCIKIFVECQQKQKFFTTNYFHVNIFNNEFFPNYGRIRILLTSDKLFAIKDSGIE